MINNWMEKFNSRKKEAETKFNQCVANEADKIEEKFIAHIDTLEDFVLLESEPKDIWRYYTITIPTAEYNEKKFKTEVIQILLSRGYIIKDCSELGIKISPSTQN